MLLPPTDPRRVALVAKKAADSAVFDAACADFQAWPLFDTAPRASKTTYKQIYGELVERVAEGEGPGADKGTAAKWLCLLMRHKGGPERIRPSDVRHNMRPSRYVKRG